jgi:hypothetical protein
MDAGSIPAASIIPADRAEATGMVPLQRATRGIAAGRSLVPRTARARRATMPPPPSATDELCSSQMHDRTRCVRGDFTGLFDRLRRFVRMILQQGRVQVDADADEQKYPSIRRILLFVEGSLSGVLRWVGFEPDDESRRSRRSRRRRQP